MSRTAGSSVNSKEKDPNPKYRITANAIPLTPPICIAEYMNIHLAPHSKEEENISSIYLQNSI
jgi:hypothetical protein